MPASRIAVVGWRDERRALRNADQRRAPVHPAATDTDPLDLAA
jgi:hypothetical protein